jgi:predicted nucleotidyltransferase
MKFGLPDAAIRDICAVLGLYPQVETAILYGSRAKGNHKPGSDIYLTLRGGPELTLPVLFRIADQLDDLLLPYTIDLSIYADIGDPGLLAHVDRVGLTFYQKGQAVQAPA